MSRYSAKHCTTVAFGHVINFLSMWTFPTGLSCSPLRWSTLILHPQNHKIAYFLNTVCHFIVLVRTLFEEPRLFQPQWLYTYSFAVENFVFERCCYLSFFLPTPVFFLVNKLSIIILVLLKRATTRHHILNIFICKTNGKFYCVETFLAWGTLEKCCKMFNRDVHDRF